MQVWQRWFNISTSIFNHFCLLFRKPPDIHKLVTVFRMKFHVRSIKHLFISYKLTRSPLAQTWLTFWIIYLFLSIFFATVSLSLSPCVYAHFISWSSFNYIKLSLAVSFRRGDLHCSFEAFILQFIRSLSVRGRHGNQFVQWRQTGPLLMHVFLMALRNCSWIAESNTYRRHKRQFFYKFRIRLNDSVPSSALKNCSSECVALLICFISCCCCC